jgi:protein involved in polysaccharide export with SLBB domain
MKASSIVVASSLFALCMHGQAQDPSFRLPSDSRVNQPAASTTSPSGSATTAAGGTYAAGINDMEVLDTTRGIKPGDILGFKIVEDKTEPRQLKVSLTGEIIAPHVGVFRAGGRTCRELAYSIKKRLEDTIYQRATVIVTIDSSPEEERRMRTGLADQETFTVFGQVIRQGKYELASDQDFTVSQAILQAGGFAQFANKEKVRLIRKTPSGAKTILINLAGIMEKGRLDQDVALRDGDVIIVKEVTFNF